MTSQDPPPRGKPGRAPDDRARRRAAFHHQGGGNWHVERTRDAIICRACKANIPYWRNPTFCPQCGDGR